MTDKTPKFSVWSDAEVWRQFRSAWLCNQLYQFFDQIFTDADIRRVENSHREVAKMAKQLQKAGLAPSMFQKYLAPMKGVWDQNKENAKKGGAALGLGNFFCRLVALYPKEMDLKNDGKVIGKCLGVIAKFTVVAGPSVGASCWKIWQFTDGPAMTAHEVYKNFQSDLVRMGMHNIDSVSEADLQQAMGDLAATTPGVKINRTANKNGATDKNGNVYVNTWVEGSVSENDLIGLGAMPRQGSAASMGGASIEEPPEGLDEPHEPAIAATPAPARPQAAAQPQAATTPARPPRSAPAAVEPVELDVGGTTAEVEPPLDEVEPPLEDDKVIAIGRTVQFRNPKTKAMSVGVVQARHSSGKGWLVREGNTADKFGIGDDNPDLKLVS